MITNKFLINLKKWLNITDLDEFNEILQETDSIITGSFVMMQCINYFEENNWHFITLNEMKYMRFIFYGLYNYLMPNHIYHYIGGYLQSSEIFNDYIMGNMDLDIFCSNKTPRIPGGNAQISNKNIKLNNYLEEIGFCCLILRNTQLKSYDIFPKVISSYTYTKGIRKVNIICVVHENYVSCNSLNFIQKYFDYPACKSRYDGLELIIESASTYNEFNLEKYRNIWKEIDDMESIAYMWSLGDKLHNHLDYYDQNRKLLIETIKKRVDKLNRRRFSLIKDGEDQQIEIIKFINSLQLS